MVRMPLLAFVGLFVLGALLTVRLVASRRRARRRRERDLVDPERIAAD